MSWTPFCTQRPGYNHEIQNANDLACPYCGQANPAPGGRTPPPGEIIILDSPSPPAVQSVRYTNHEPAILSAARPSPHFSVLDQQSNTARQKSITRSQQTAEARPNAGTIVHSTRPRTTLPVSAKVRLASIRKSFPLSIQIYIGELDDLTLMIYNSSTWRHIS
jgi:hypothetical protein